MAIGEEPEKIGHRKACALWFDGPRAASVREEALPRPASGEALVAMLWSGVSRGTERVVFEGRAPKSLFGSMRAPMQRGEFPFPVKYGYCAVGRVLTGPNDLVEKAVFCLHPHQDFFVAPLAALFLIPDTIPPRRAVLAANMETALNGVWDSGAGPGDRIVVIGGGVIGLLVAGLAARLPGSDVLVVDRDCSRAPVAQRLGARFAEAASFKTGFQEGADVVFHASASQEGLELALACAGFEANIVDLSWYGATPVALPLGEAFHANRLRLISSQVGAVAASRRPRWPLARRLAKAIELLADERFDALITEELAFADLAESMARLLAPGAPGLATAVRYGSF